MILITAILIGLLVGLALGGSLRALSTLSLRWPLLAVASVVAQRMLIYWPELISSWPPLKQVVVASYGALIIFGLANLKLAPMRFVTVGLLLNAAVIFANGGAMPVTREALTAARPHPGIATLEYGDPVPGTKDVLLPRGETLLWPLSDILVLPGPDPIGTTFSVGDILIAVGAFWVTVRSTKPRSAWCHRPNGNSQQGLKVKADNP